MAVSWAQVVLIAPALSTMSTAQQDLFLSLADAQIDDDAWGAFADEGRLYLTAHLATAAAAGGGGAGPVTAEAVGAMSRSYAAPMGVRGSLATTRYGLLYLDALQRLPASIGFVP